MHVAYVAYIAIAPWSDIINLRELNKVASLYDFYADNGYFVWDSKIGSPYNNVIMELK